jgi:hypothetical protein
MVREPDATMQPAPHDIQLMSKHRVLSFKPHLRLEWRGQDGQNETEQPDHSASLGDSVTASTRIRFSVHTTRIIMAKQTKTVHKKSRGRPTGIKYGETIPARLEPATVARLDAWATSHEVSRSEAIRRLVELGLKAKGK